MSAQFTLLFNSFPKFLQFWRSRPQAPVNPEQAQQLDSERPASELPQSSDRDRHLKQTYSLERRIFP
jgi:hypothetical protein